MAGNPFDQFDAPAPPAQKANPFDTFDQPAAQPAAAPPPQAPSSTPGDSILDHLHRFSVGLNSATRVATDAATFGLMDKLFGSQAQTDTAQAYKDVGAAAIPLSLAGSLATGGPELKAASMLGDAIGLGRVGSAIGSGAVGAGSGALGAYGHEAGWTPNAGDIGKGALIGGALGAGGGALSGPAVEAGQVAGRQFTPRALPAAQSADDLEAAAKQAYAPLSNILYDAGNEVHPALDVTNAKNALRDWSGYKWGDASKTSKEVQTLLDKPQLSANDLQQSQSYLKGIASNPNSDPNDQLYASYFGKQLQSVLDKGTPQTGVPQNWTPGAPGQSYASTVKAAGDLLHGRAQDMGRVETMLDKAGVTGGPDMGNQARSYLTSDQGQTFAPPGSPQYQGFNTVAGTAAKDEYVPWWVKHFVIAPTVGGVANELFGAMSGQEHGGPMQHIGEDLAVGGSLALGTMGYSGLTGRVNRLAQQRAVDALKSTLTTGASQAPLQATTPVRNALQMLLLGQSGRY